jgi:hypothetical protein
MSLLAIDPGSAGQGNAAARFEHERLGGAWFERFANADQVRDRRTNYRGLYYGPTFATVIVERPDYQGKRSDAARVADLIALAWSGALLAGAYAGRDGAELVEYTPRQWKGSEQKPIHHARLWAVLDAGERAILGGAATERRILEARERGALSRWAEPSAAYYGSWTGHNLLDAVALGCVHLGRLEKK